MTIVRLLLCVPLGKVGKLVLAAHLLLILTSVIALSQTQANLGGELVANPKARQVLATETSQDWAQWGGPDRNFISDATGLADSWPATGPRQLWSRPLGNGHSTIIVENGRLYTMYRPTREGSRSGEFAAMESVISLDATTGETLWEYSYAAQPLNFRFGAGPH